MSTSLTDVPGEAQQWLQAGRIGRPHGLDGSFYVTRPRAVLLEQGAGVRVEQRDFAIERRAGTDEKPIVRLAGVTTPEAAEELRGQAIFCPLADAPRLGEREWWAEELEGCSVIDGTVNVGEVARLLVLPSCEVLEVKRPDGTELLVPMVSDAIRSVDVEQRKIEVNLAFVGGA
ncbi:MAG: 16S rRNA processing protein RimM [Actinobacteria bacterium]|nr:16S rRNA processing protein RimM [Actinomycetota bacterium]